MSIKVQIQKRLSRSKRYVFMRADFKDIAGYDQVGRVLRGLVKDGDVAKKSVMVSIPRPGENSITGRLMPACPGGSDAVILEALERLNVDYSLGRSSTRYFVGGIYADPRVYTNRNP